MKRQEECDPKNAFLKRGKKEEKEDRKSGTLLTYVICSKCKTVKYV